MHRLFLVRKFNGFIENVHRKSKTLAWTKQLVYDRIQLNKMTVLIVVEEELCFLMCRFTGRVLFEGDNCNIV